MSTSVTSGKITLTDTVPGSVSIRKLGRSEWLVEQNLFEEVDDHNQNATWLEIRNRGPAAKLRVHVKWAAFEHMNHRRCGYQRKGGKYSVIRGEITPETTIYDVTVPKGTSYFGAAPWYDLDDAARFFARMKRKSGMCKVRSIGKTGDGRDITCLTIGSAEGSKRKRNVVLMARVHANETAGSWALEATADYLLSGEAPRRLLEKYAFHIFPAINPDGVARGIKFTRPGPRARYNLEFAGMTSDDPTIAAVREEMLRLKPHALVDHHGYLIAPLMLFTYDKALALKLLTELVREDAPAHQWWFYTRTTPSDQIRQYCHEIFKTRVVITELPWAWRLPSDIEAAGVKIFKALQDVVLK